MRDPPPRWASRGLPIRVACSKARQRVDWPAIELAAHSYSFRDRPLDEALQELGALGFGVAELWAGHAADGAGAAARSAAAAGLRVAAVGAGGFYERGGRETRAVFELAEATGAPVVVACVAPWLLPEVVRLVPPGITLCVENHWDQDLARPGEVLRALAAAAPTDRVAACLDTGHAILAGIAAERFAAELGPRLGHVHLKEARRPPLAQLLMGRRARDRLLARPEPAHPGTGSLAVDRLRRALERVGYDGVVTVEHEGPRPAEALDELRARWSQAERPTPG